jgi:hypothetical protein
LGHEFTYKYTSTYRYLNMADANDSAAILAQVNDDLKNLGYISQATADRMRDAETGVKDFNTKMALGGKAVTALADAGMAAASAMYKGEKGAAAFNSSIDSMAEAATAAGAVLTLMIPGGVIVKALVAGMTLAVGAIAKYTKAANEMSDTLYTTFQKMSKSGAAASDGLTGIYGDMQKLGLGIQDLDGYVDMINASSRDLALFGGSVFAGRKAFADIGAAMTPFREQLYNAGLSQEQVNAGAMSYLKLQTQLGQAQKMTTTELAVGAKKYLIEMDALAKITGETRENNEKALEEVRSQERFRAHIEDLVAQGKTTEAKEVENTYLRLRVFNKALAQGFADIQGGDMTTEASRKALMSTQGEIITQSHRLAQGLSNSTQAFQGIGRAAGNTAETLRPLAKFGVYNQTFSDFAGDVELGRAARLDMAEVDKKVAAEQERQGVTGKKAADELQQAQTSLRLKQLDAMQAAQDFVAKGMLPATYAAIKMAGATESAATGLNNFMDGLTKLTKWLFGWLQGEEARAKTKEEIAADEKAAAAKAKYDKAFAGVPGGNMAQRELGIGATAEQKAALEERKAAQAAAVQARKAADAKYGTTKESAAAAGMPSAGTTAGPAGAPSGGMTAQDLASAGLEIRGHGDVQAPGQEVSPALIELAKKIQKSVPGFEYFSGFNDQFHNEKSPRSLHTQGLAADFVLGKKPSKEEGEHIVDLLKSLGASKAIDEYHSPSAKATGGHFHVEIPKFGDGGISTQPELAIVGEKGPEAHVPLKGGSIPVSINLGNDNAKKTTDIDSVLDSVERAFKNQEAARKQNVSISLSDATVGQFFGGNEFTGPNVGGLTTDMDALKDIAAKLGAYDAQNEIITNPNTWKEIIKSGMLQNYDVGVANIGSRMIGDDAGNILGERVKEVMEMNKVDVNTALTQTAKEFKDAMLQIVTQMQQQKDPELQAQMVEHLAAISRSGASTATASERLAQVASN